MILLVDENRVFFRFAFSAIFAVNYFTRSPCLPVLDVKPDGRQGRLPPVGRRSRAAQVPGQGLTASPVRSLPDRAARSDPGSPGVDCTVDQSHPRHGSSDHPLLWRLHQRLPLLLKRDVPFDGLLLVSILHSACSNEHCHNGKIQAPHSQKKYLNGQTVQRIIR